MAGTEFSGNYAHNIDPKGRATIPAAFRDALGVGFTIGMNNEFNAIALYPADRWRELSEQLDKLEALRDKMSALFGYYGSEAWYEDREAWDAAYPDNIPDGVAAGVLSEDLVYDEITEMRELAFRMIESGTDVLKNRL